MESNKAPFHDFAPSWLKLSNLTNDISTCEKSELIETTDEFDLRPQYLKKDTSSQENEANIKSGANNHLIKEFNSKSNFSTSRFNHSFNYDSNDFRKYSSLNGNTNINSLNNSVSNNTSTNSNINNNINTNNNINIDNNINNNKKFSSRLKSGDLLRKPNSRSEFREDGNSFFHLKNHSQYGNKSKFNPVFESLIGLEDKSSNLNSSKNKISLKPTNIADSNTFKEEFPSLVDENVINIETSNSNNVWDNVKKKVLSTSSKKVNIFPRAVCFTDSSNNSTENNKGFEENNFNIGSNFYRTLVPVVPKKRSNNGLNNNAKDNNTLVNSLSNLSLGQNAKILPVFSKSRDHSSSSQSMEILVKKHPKMRRNKNEFLRTLRSSSDNSRADQEKDSYGYKEKIKNKSSKTNLEINQISSNSNKDQEDDKVLNCEGVQVEEDIKENGVSYLSSSLEAEERLLREMGWKEEEDDKIYAPLTEAEVNEFKDLIKSSRHDNVKRSFNLNQQLQFILSPKKIISPLNCLKKAINGDHQAQEENSDSTSDEDDSDIDA